MSENVISANSLSLLNEEMAKEWLKPVLDPDIMMSLVDLGLIYGVTVEPESGQVSVAMTLTTPACPHGPMMVEDVRRRMMEYPGVKEVKVDVVWEPKWDPREMASDECKDLLGLW